MVPDAGALDMVFDDRKMSLGKRLDPLADRCRGIAREEHQFSKSRVQISLRRNERSPPSIHHADDVGGLAEVAKWFAVPVDGGIDHLRRNAKRVNQKCEGDENERARSGRHRSNPCSFGESPLEHSHAYRYTADRPAVYIRLPHDGSEIRIGVLR